MGIFTNSYTSSKNFSAQGAVMLWNDGSSSSKMFPMLLTQLRLQYGRNITPMLPINVSSDGSLSKINLIGSPSGTFSCSGLLCESVARLLEFIKAASDGCAESPVNVSITPFAKGSCKQLPFTILISNLLLANTTFDIQGNEFGLITQGLSGVFSDLDLKEGSVITNTVTG